MTASRNPTRTNAAAAHTARPENRLRRSDTALRFNLIVDDYDTIDSVTRTAR